MRQQHWRLAAEFQDIFTTVRMSMEFKNIIFCSRTLVRKLSKTADTILISGISYWISSSFHLPLIYSLQRRLCLACLLSLNSSTVVLVFALPSMTHGSTFYSSKSQLQRHPNMRVISLHHLQNTFSTHANLLNFYSDYFNRLSSLEYNTFSQNTI